MKPKPLLLFRSLQKWVGNFSNVCEISVSKHLRITCHAITSHVCLAYMFECLQNNLSFPPQNERCFPS